MWVSLLQAACSTPGPWGRGAERAPLCAVPAGTHSSGPWHGAGLPAHPAQLLCAQAATKLTAVLVCTWRAPRCEHGKSSASGTAPSSRLWNPSPSCPGAHLLWGQADIPVSLFQLSLCWFSFTSRCFTGHFACCLCPFLPLSCRPRGTAGTVRAPPEPQWDCLELCAAFEALSAHQQRFLPEDLHSLFQKVQL